MTGRLSKGVMWDVKTAHYLKKRPGRPFARFLSGWASLAYGSGAHAEAFFDGALEADAGYAPAHIGKICCLVRKEKYRKAAQYMCRHSESLGLHGAVQKFRLASAISACALRTVRDWADGYGKKRWPAAFFGAVNTGGVLRGLPAGSPLAPYVTLLRYIELLARRMPGALRLLPSERRDAPEPAGAKPPPGDSGRDAVECRALARGLYNMPGILDELRFIILNDLPRGAEGLGFTFDDPSIFSKALLNGLFREKIFAGELREPRVILSNLRKASGARRIDNANKWMFLRLCRALGRDGELELHTARELENDGWWADPIVCSYIYDS